MVAWSGYLSTDELLKVRDAAIITGIARTDSRLDALLSGIDPFFAAALSGAGDVLMRLFYTARPGGGLLGWATFPVELEGDPTMDGVVILDSALPDGTSRAFSLGRTAVHEVGHWLGLYHTFQDGCTGLGDEVKDTPAHAGPNFGQPVDDGQPYNLCGGEPAGSLCPIHNYMNYCDDVWMTEFTPGQKERAWAQIGMFRTGLLPAGGGANRIRESGASIEW